MENFRPYLRKHKKWAISIATLIWLFLVTMTLLFIDEKKLFHLLQNTLLYWMLLALILDKDKPLEAVEELYLYPHYIQEAEKEIIEQGFVKKTDQKKLKRFVKKVSNFRNARIKVDLHPEGYWIIKAKKKYLLSLEDYRLRFVG
jgi:hypothetical protein